MTRDRIIRIIAIIAALIALGVGIWLCATDNDDDEETDTTATPAAVVGGDETSEEDDTASSLDDETVSQLTDLAERFEHAARDWGTDPTAATSDDNAQQDGNSLLTDLRTPADMTRDVLDTLTTIETEDGDGPHGDSPWCRYHDDRCDTSSDALDYWRNMDWLLGARVTDMSVDVQDENTIVVDGQSTLIVWTDGDDAAYRGTGDDDAYWAFTPAIATVSWTDTLTVENGMITDRSVDGSSGGWLADPWYEPWDENPVRIITNLSAMSQANIPLKGLPPDLLDDDYDIAYDGLENVQATDGDLWDDVSTSEIPDTSCDGCYE